jgi:N-acetylglucosamine-6-phosphate deacetylase
VVATCGGLPHSNADLSPFDFEALVDRIPGLRVMTISPSLEARTDFARLRILLKKNVTPGTSSVCIGVNAVSR